MKSEEFATALIFHSNTEAVPARGLPPFVSNIIVFLLGKFK